MNLFRKSWETMKPFFSKPDPSFRRRSFSTGGCEYSQLEGRTMLTSVVFENRVLSLFGTDAVDDVRVASVAGGANVRVYTAGNAPQDFARSQIQEIVFVGVGGDDIFENSTDVPSRAYGNDGNDRLSGGSGDDVLIGGGGSDFIRGNAGDDTIRGIGGGNTPNDLAGGTGDDRIFGGAGDNIIDGGSGNDVVFGSSGNDEVDGGVGDDDLYVGNGTNVVRGGTGNDIVVGGAGVDTVFGEAGMDRIYSLGGNDDIDGGDGADVLFGGDGDDRHVGGAGDDQIRTGRGNDFADAGSGDDFISGFQGNNTLNGGIGADRINAGTGHDIVNGGDGNDKLFGQAGDDVIDGGEGADFVFEQSGENRVRGGAGDDVIYGGSNDDFLDGGDGDDTIVGLAGNDQLFGGGGSDWLLGSEGLDGLSGGYGTDTLFGGSGADRFLSLSGDDRRDIGSSDALIEFRTGSRSWTHREIEVLDDGLKRLHVGTGGTRVLKDSLDPEPLKIFKEAATGNNGEAGLNRLESNFAFTTTGQIQSETFKRTIEIADWNENDDTESANRAAIIIHEIAHNWDSSREISEVFSGQGSIWTRFLSVNGWRTTPATGFTRSSAQSSEPFDLVFNPANNTFTQVVTTWYYRNDATFAREYGSTNAQEDWATVWEAAFSDDPEDRVGLSSHIAAVDRLLNLL